MQLSVAVCRCQSEMGPDAADIKIDYRDTLRYTRRALEALTSGADSISAFDESAILMEYVHLLIPIF